MDHFKNCKAHSAAPTIFQSDNNGILYLAKNGSLARALISVRDLQNKTFIFAKLRFVILLIWNSALQNYKYRAQTICRNVDISFMFFATQTLPQLWLLYPLAKNISVGLSFFLCLPMYKTLWFCFSAIEQLQTLYWQGSKLNPLSSQTDGLREKLLLLLQNFNLEATRIWKCLLLFNSSEPSCHSECAQEL